MAGTAIEAGTGMGAAETVAGATEMSGATAEHGWMQTGREARATGRAVTAAPMERVAATAHVEGKLPGARLLATRLLATRRRAATPHAAREREASHHAAMWAHPGRSKPRAQNRRIERQKPAVNARSAPNGVVGADGGVAAVDGAKAARAPAADKAPRHPTASRAQPMAYAVTTARARSTVVLIRVAATRRLGLSPRPHRIPPRRNHFRRRQHPHRAHR